jgi:hypothetical protein
MQVARCFACCWWVRGKRRGWQGVIGGVFVGGAGLPLLCPLLVGSGGFGGSVSVGGIFISFIFTLFFILLFFFDRWHFGGKGNLDGRLEYSFKNDGIIEVCRYKKLYGMEPGILS